METMNLSMVFAGVLVLSIIFGGGAGSGTTAEANPGSSELEQLAREIVAAYSAQDVDRILSHVSNDVVTTSPDGRSMRGKEAYRKELLENDFKFLPDLTMETENVFATESQVCIQWNAKGTHLGQAESAAPKDKKDFSRKAVSFRGVTILEVRKGKVVRSCAYYDRATILAQLGVLQPPQQ